MMPLAQFPDTAWGGLAQGGVLAVIIGLLIWRDWHKDKKFDQLTESINHLTRAITLEVLSRPGVVQRAKDEAREIQDAIERK